MISLIRSYNNNNKEVLDFGNRFGIKSLDY